MQIFYFVQNSAIVDSLGCFVNGVEESSSVGELEVDDVVSFSSSSDAGDVIGPPSSAEHAGRLVGVHVDGVVGDEVEGGVVLEHASGHHRRVDAGQVTRLKTAHDVSAHLVAVVPRFRI